jgi:hypothetical protein
MDHLRFTAYILTPIFDPDFVILNGLKRYEMDISRQKRQKKVLQNEFVKS